MNAWNLNPEHSYVLEDDRTVRALLFQLGIPDLFSSAPKVDPFHVFAAFENHPTHWIAIHLWRGVPAYSPNHGIHRLSRQADSNGLLFVAEPKDSVSRSEMAANLDAFALNGSVKAPFEFQQLPVV